MEMKMKKNYVIIDKDFWGKVDYENNNSISVDGSLWSKSRIGIKRINYVQYRILILLEWILNKMIDLK